MNKITIRHQDWFRAIYFYEYGQRAYLSELIKTKSIPKEIRHVIAEFIMSDDKFNYRSSRLKVPVEQRFDSLYRLHCELSYMENKWQSYEKLPGYTTQDDKKKYDLKILNYKTAVTKELSIDVSAVTKARNDFMKRLGAWPF